MKNINIKRFLPALGILVAIIVIILVIVYSSNKQENTNLPEDDNVNSVNENIENNESTSNEDVSDSEQSEENSLDVPQVDTSSTNEYVDDSGEQIEGGTIEDTQAKIEEKFKSIPLDRLNLQGVYLNSAKIIFGEGVMKIANKDCFGFSVYVLDGSYMKSAGTFAMSMDTEVLYRYDTSSMTYIFVNMN